MSDLNKKIDHAIKLLRLIPTDTEPAELCYSGGKDSDVILRLAQMAGIKYRAIYKNTTIDPSRTILADFRLDACRYCRICRERE